MVKVYMNPGKLEERISDLEKFAQSVREAQSSVSSMYGESKEPIESGESLASLQSAVNKAVLALEDRAKEVRKSKTTMMNLASNGVAHYDILGGIGIQVPDDSAGLENADKFQKWGQGAADANDLRSGKDKLPSGRSFDEVMESMKANKDDTTYANSFIDRVGPENLTNIGDKNPSKNKEAYTIGEILATASQTWDKEKSKRNADLIIGSVDDESEWNRIPIFSKMIGGHDADNDGVSDLKFGPDFLAFMGDGAEQLRYQEINDTMNPERGSGAEGPGGRGRYYDSRTYDPLYCIVDAMTNNGAAAAMFFGKNGVNASGEDIKRIQRLATRYGFGKNKWTDNLSIISGKMSELGRIDTTKASSEQIALSDQAALGTGVILNKIGQSRAQLSNTALPYIDIALKNYAPGVDHSIAEAGKVPEEVATRTTYLSGKIPGNSGRDDYGDAFWGGGVPTQPNFSDSTLSHLTGQLGFSEKGLSGLQTELGYIADRRMNFAANYYTSEGEKSAALKTAISNYQKTEGFIAGAISREGINRGVNSDKQVKQWIDGLSGISAFAPIPGLKEGTSQAVKKLYEAGVSYSRGRLEKAGMAEAEKALVVNQENAEIEANNRITMAENSTRDALFVKMIQSGVIKQETLASWANRDANILNADGTLNYEKLNGRNVKVDEDALKEKYGNGEEFEKAKAAAVEDKASDRVNVDIAFQNFKARMDEVTEPWSKGAYDEASDTEFDESVKRAGGVPYGLTTTEGAEEAALNQFGEK